MFRLIIGIDVLDCWMLVLVMSVIFGYWIFCFDWRGCVTGRIAQLKLKGIISGKFTRPIWLQMIDEGQNENEMEWWSWDVLKWQALPSSCYSVTWRTHRVACAIVKKNGVKLSNYQCLCANSLWEFETGCGKKDEVLWVYNSQTPK